MPLISFPDAQVETAAVLREIVDERIRQNKIFGMVAGFDDDPPHVRLAVLQKKLGDYAVAVAQELDYFAHIKTRNPRQELIELAAVCVALLEVPV